jgi:hypothetical protein
MIALPRWFNSWQPEIMLGVEHGIQRSADADRQGARLSITAAIIFLSRNEQW